MPANRKGIVLECDEAGLIRTIVFNNLVAETTSWAGVSFFALLEADSTDNGLYFWESVAQFGHAEGWPVKFQVADTVLPLTLSGARMGQSVMLMGYESDGELITINPVGPADLQVSAVTDSAYPDESELLNELSRLNNELVNAKRELIRQNVKLKRLQNPWDEGLTFI